MPFMVLGSVDAPEDWTLAKQRVRPEDGALVRRWTRSCYDRVAQLEHTQDRYEVLRGDNVVVSELHSRSPATRWYTRAQAAALYRDGGSSTVRAVSGFTDQRPPAADDRLFTVFGHRPG
jgi:hypothetical protein